MRGRGSRKGHRCGRGGGGGNERRLGCKKGVATFAGKIRKTRGEMGGERRGNIMKR